MGRETDRIIYVCIEIHVVDYKALTLTMTYWLRSPKIRS